jgi:hypothetical protein
MMMMHKYSRGASVQSFTAPAVDFLPDPQGDEGTWDVIGAEFKIFDRLKRE